MIPSIRDLRKTSNAVFQLLCCNLLNAQNPPVLEEFRDPGREYTLLPFWSWNGTLEEEELKRQIDLMIDKGVSGAFMHARAGINYGETPYFSEGWWDVVETTVKYANRRGEGHDRRVDRTGPCPFGHN